jgi:ABC-type Fe3+/spermidine/putrescine transport system ATPase subunit
MIEIKNAHKSLGEFSLRGVDLRLEQGEYFVVLGPTGAGKTVLLEAIAGLHRLDQGEVWVEGRDVTALAPELRRIGYVPQDYVLFPHMSLRRNIGFSLELQRVPAAQIGRRVQQLADLLNIAHLLDRRPRTLSGGEQQRGALARALAPEPTVLLLDEPLSALDEGTRAELSVELARISDELRTTVVHVCHNFDEALELADRIAIMHHGRVLQVGTPAEVFRRPASPFIARFVGAQNLFPVLAVDRANKTVTLADQLTLTVAALPEGDDLLVMIRPEEIAVHRAEGPDSSAPRWVLQTVEDRGRVMRLRLHGPLPLRVTMTPQAFAAAQVSEGDTVLASWSAQAVHVLPR